MKISIIIPYFKREEHINLCLQGLLKQTYEAKEYEIIIIGQSYHFTEYEALVSLSTLDHTIRSIYFPVEEYDNFPASKLRNRGALESSGEILIFIDCDMIVSSDFLQNIEEYHKNDILLHAENKNHKDMVSYTSYTVTFSLRRKLLKDTFIDSITQLRKQPYEKDEREVVASFFNNDIEFLESLWLFVYSHTMSISKRCFMSLGMFQENFLGWGLEDSEFAYRCKCAGIKFVCDKKSKCYHIWHPENFNKRKYEKYKENIKLFKDLHNDSSLNGLELCLQCLNPKNTLKLSMEGISPQALSLFLYESYLRGYKDKNMERGVCY